MAGIQAQYEGTCTICGERYFPGDMIDRIPGDPDQRRGHNECVRAGAVVQRRAAPAARTQQAPPAGVRTRRPEPEPEPEPEPPPADPGESIDELYDALYDVGKALLSMATLLHKAGAALTKATAPPADR